MLEKNFKSLSLTINLTNTAYWGCRINIWEVEERAVFPSAIHSLQGRKKKKKEKSVCMDFLSPGRILRPGLQGMVPKGLEKRPLIIFNIFGAASGLFFGQYKESSQFTVFCGVSVFQSVG